MPSDQPFERVTTAGLSATDEIPLFIVFSLVGKRIHDSASSLF
jgi:hypothetical protein